MKPPTFGRKNLGFVWKWCFIHSPAGLKTAQDPGGGGVNGQSRAFKGVNLQALTSNSGCLHVNSELVFQAVNVSTDLEGGTEFDVHGGHEVLLLQQEQRLSVNFLRQELGGEVLTA